MYALPPADRVFQNKERRLKMSQIAFTRAVQLGFFAALMATGLRSAAQQAPWNVPYALKPPAGEQLVLHALAFGDQIYTCDGSKWTLSGPDAKLSDEAGREAGSHFAGPTWQWSDGSRVTAKPVANAMPDPESIPWLLLTATVHEGDGVMKNVSSIQRLRTKGGKAPASGCTASHKDEKMRVHYTADYYFYAPKR
jgi:FtsP/CotA-like multicopper oxidase with cupredoxin domain